MKIEPSDSREISSVFPELGEACDGICVAEAKLELDYGSARSDLSIGNSKVALTALRKIEASLSIANSLTFALWLPIVRYWIGVASACLGQEDATEVLVSLIGGVKDPDARAQLAILSIQKVRLNLLAVG